LHHLLLLRHAKSDWSATFETDRDRPLASRGVAAAGLMGGYLARVRMPVLVLSSPALRARQTAELARSAGSWPCTVQVEESLYGGSTTDLLEVLRRQPAAAKVICLVGHEPIWSMAVALLTGGGAVRMPTAAVADVAFELRDWSRIEPASGELRSLVTPKLLKRSGLS
jgi:phosphohistidine phosphatase